jgi:hypothetical protein
VNRRLCLACHVCNASEGGVCGGHDG